MDLFKAAVGSVVRKGAKVGSGAGLYILYNVLDSSACDPGPGGNQHCATPSTGSTESFLTQLGQLE